MKRAGQCCDECAAAKGSCQYQGAVRYHGDMWNSTGCEFCTCSRGQVLCQRAECGRVECPQVSPKGKKKCSLKPRGKTGPILKICGCKVKIKRLKFRLENGHLLFFLNEFPHKQDSCRGAETSHCISEKSFVYLCIFI